MKRKTGIGIVGCGVIANFHANAVREIPDAVLVGVTDVVRDAAEKFSRRYGIEVIDTLDEMLARPDIDIVNICTPSGYHADAVIKAAKAKKNIIVEKPMGITTEQLDNIVVACDENKVKLSCISQCRYYKSVLKVKEAIEEGLLGRIVSADIYMKYNRTQEYYDSGSWRGTQRVDGGGALMNQGIHGVDLLQYLVGPVKRVFAFSKTLVRNIEVEDTLSAVVDFANGANGVIQATTSVFPGYPRRLEINGERGSIALEETSIVRWDIATDSNSQDVVLMPAYTHSASSPTAISGDGHTMQIADMVNAVRHNERPFIDQHEGRKPVDIILAIYKSAKENRVIEL